MEQHAISSDLIRGHIDTIILHTLLSGDKFAQQISDSIEEKSGGEYKINQATLYSSLKRLEGLKHVSSYWYDASSGRRKYFKLTDLGKNTVENNLSSWSYSRAVIDKLMDCSPQPIYKIEYVEKIVPVEKSNSPVVNSNLEQPKQDLESEQKVENTSVNGDTKQEVNFRNILNGLIKSTEVVHEKQPTTDIEPLENYTVEPAEQPEKLKFNDTLSSTDYNAHKYNNNGKIDFGDLTLKAAKEGYKIRISSKDSTATEGTLLINKLNVFSAVILFVLMTVELLCFSLRYNTLYNFDFLTIFLTSLFIAVFPIVSVVKYFKKPKEKTPKKIYSDVLLTVAIIIFNVLLITFAINLLCGVSFSDKYTILLSLVVPALLCVDVFVYYIIKFFLSKLSKFYVKK